MRTAAARAHGHSFSACLYFNLYSHLQSRLLSQHRAGPARANWTRCNTGCLGASRLRKDSSLKFTYRGSVCSSICLLFCAPFRFDWWQIAAGNNCKVHPSREVHLPEKSLVSRLLQIDKVPVGPCCDSAASADFAQLPMAAVLAREHMRPILQPHGETWPESSVQIEGLGEMEEAGRMVSVQPCAARQSHMRTSE